MGLTVIQAFNKFMLEIINLNPDDTKKAKDSRAWLIEQICTFPSVDSSFPEIYTEKNINYGSFSRRTKKRPLDDIDIMVCLKADGCTYIEYGDKIEITVPNTSTRFLNLKQDGTNLLNSRKVINTFIKKLGGIHQYKKAEISRNSEAAVLNLTSYDWVFDIVPCFFTTEDANKKTYYIIPDGNGNWKKTDPRLDSQRVYDVNNFHDKNVLNVIRAVKYWNNRPTMPTMGSYLLENMILDYNSEQTTKASKYVDVELENVFFAIHNKVYSSVYDPKKIQGDLNDLSTEDKKKIFDRAYQDYVKAFNARQFENNNNNKDSIKLWIEIFGDKFPTYD